MRAIRKLNVAVLLLAMAAGVAVAKPVTYSAQLTSSAEVPPNTSQATGNVDATFDTDSKMLMWTITYDKLSGPATMAHFHGPAPVGVNAKPVVTIEPSQLASPIKGMATLTDQQVADLSSGKWYFNVHTAKNPAGEIRGQMMPKN